MEIRLNKLISEAGVCSRREADNFIEMERVTVNGKQPHVGQKVTAEDVVLVDGERLNVEKYIRLQEEEKKEVQQEKELLGTLRKAKPENKGGREGAKMEKFGKFNKYAAALTPQVRKGTEQIGGGAADRRQPEIGRPSEDKQEQPDQQGETCRPPEKQESRRR